MSQEYEEPTIEELHAEVRTLRIFVELLLANELAKRTSISRMIADMMEGTAEDLEERLDGKDVTERMRSHLVLAEGIARDFLRSAQETSALFEAND